MVDFNNDVTVGMPAVDIERVSVLQRRYEFIDSYQYYKKQRLNQVVNKQSLSNVRTSLMVFFMQMQGMIKRRFKEEDYKKLYDSCFESQKEEDIMKAFFIMNEDLDRMNLTKIDTKRAVDTSIAEEENKAAGL